MLQQDFVPPSPDVSQKETARRIKALETFLPRIQKAVTSISVSGSMASGQNYAVTEKSDLDLQITITKDSVALLKETNIFPPEAFNKPLTAYFDNQISQFSFSVDIEGIPHECHFWDQQAIIDAMEMKSVFTKRVRTSNSAPAIDYGFAFDGTQNAYECPTEELNGTFISVLPSFQRVDGKLFLSRPVTNWLSTPYIILGEEILTPHINNTWEKVIIELVNSVSGELNLSSNNILNALPSKFKASPEAKEKILVRTMHELDRLGIRYGS